MPVSFGWESDLVSGSGQEVAVVNMRAVVLLGQLVGQIGEAPGAMKDAQAEGKHGYQTDRGGTDLLQVRSASSPQPRLWPGMAQPLGPCGMTRGATHLLQRGVIGPRQQLSRLRAGAHERQGQFGPADAGGQLPAPLTRGQMLAQPKRIQ